MEPETIEVVAEPTRDQVLEFARIALRNAPWDEDRFKEEVRILIDKANLSQFVVALALHEIGNEQMAEWDDREPGDVE